tara:strand:+ start:1349 stop:1561 length:213 start_codon:yes stop_codon:yes gene_type:complete
MAGDTLTRALDKYRTFRITIFLYSRIKPDNRIRQVSELADKTALPSIASARVTNQIINRHTINPWISLSC